MSDLDRETTQAAEALARRIRARDAAIRGEDADVADAEPFAREFMLTLRGRGWRPTAAKSGAPPKHAPAGTATAPRDETIRSLRADMEARAAAARAAKEGAA